jgi:ADP-ribose pyrophosphatase YjhB (NUDIX family)
VLTDDAPAEKRGVATENDMGRSARRKVPQQVGVIAVRHDSGKIQVCLIRRKGSERWGIPKGFIDPGNTPKEAALAEASEEAGLEGELIGDRIGTYDYEKRGLEYTVAVYVMKVVEERDDWLEMEVRERRWSTLQQAHEMLGDHPVRPLLDRVTSRVPEAVA